jgi:hypothetical protein
VKLGRLDASLPTRGPADPAALMALAERHNVAGPVRRLVDAVAGAAH